MENNLFNIEAEQAVLGTIIMNNEYLRRVSDILDPKHFYEPVHQKIYEQILKCLADEIVANVVSLKVFFRNEVDPLFKNLEENQSYLSILLAESSAIIDIRDYAKIVVNLWKQRDLLEIVQKLGSSSYQQVSSELRSKLDEHDQGNELELTHISQAVNESLESKEEILRFGYYNLDQFLGGIDAGNLVIIAGRPSMGKTTLAVNLAMQSSKKYFTIFFSFEVKEKSIARKVISNLRAYTTAQLKENVINESEKNLIKNDDFLQKSKLYLNDKPRQNTNKIRGIIAKAVKRGLKMVFIDYLGMIPCDKKTWSKANEIEIIINELKAIAFEFNIAIVVLCQLNRSLEGRTNHKPVLSDLRDSGAIEQTADIVLFVHREEYYLSKAKPFKFTELQEWERDMAEVRGKSQVIVAKNRDGETGEVELFFDGKFSRFTELN